MVSFVFYYFVHPSSMFLFYSKATVWELILCAGFMFFAIFQNRDSEMGSGASFKITLISLSVGLLLSNLFNVIFSNVLAEELNPTYLENSKKHKSCT